MQKKINPPIVSGKDIWNAALTDGNRRSLEGAYGLDFSGSSWQALLDLLRQYAVEAAFERNALPVGTRRPTKRKKVETVFLVLTRLRKASTAFLDALRKAASPTEGSILEEIVDVRWEQLYGEKQHLSMVS